MFRTLAMLIAFAVSVGAQMKDAPGKQDPPHFTRMPGYYLANDGVRERQFDFHNFIVGVPGRNPKPERIEGHFLEYWYRFDPKSGVLPGDLQIMRNYEAAAVRMGGKKMFEDRFRIVMMIPKQGGETWVDIEPHGSLYKLWIVERQAMKQDVVANVDAFRTGLKETGHVEVPGILFDFNQSVVKPESAPALQDVANLLKGEPAMKVWVVGHTDSVGGAESNLALSRARAAAVVAYLTQKLGIAPARLASFGAGPFAPVASNASEDGRAENRRVELVVQP